MMYAIEVTNLSKTFKGKGGAAVEALKSITFTIEQGEIFGFLGPNGAGKSTTIKALMGLIFPTSGSASIMGIDVASHHARRHVGFLPENPAFYDYLNAEEYLAFAGEHFGMSKLEIINESERVLKLLELWDARKRSVRSYSKGMVQRLGLAQVLIHDPDVYILDEPMSGLDPIGRALVKDIILDLKNRGKCVFFSTHITADVETVCDRVGIIIQGSLKSVELVHSVLMGGITGYSIRQPGPLASMPVSEVYVAKEELTKFMAAAYEKGEEIILVEPRRKNLEEYFLDFVKGKSC
jgi:ABC-2 type transport system ATP-binding protein